MHVEKYTNEEIRIARQIIGLIAEGCNGCGECGHPHICDDLFELVVQVNRRLREEK